MTSEEFEKVLKGMQELENSILLKKGSEYNQGNDDRLKSFKELAEYTKTNPLLICFVFMSKHYQSLSNYVKEGREISEESIEERIADLRNYLALFKAIIVENKMKKNATASLALVYEKPFCGKSTKSTTTENSLNLKNLI